MSKSFSQSEQNQIVSLKNQGLSLRAIAKILHRRYSDVLEEARRLFYVTQPPPIVMHFVRDTMSYTRYKRLRSKVRDNWLWQVTFVGIWGTVSKPRRFVKTAASSKAKRTLNYDAQLLEARDNSKDLAMGKLASSDIFLAKLISIDINRIRGLKRK